MNIAFRCSLRSIRPRSPFVDPRSFNGGRCFSSSTEGSSAHIDPPNISALAELAQVGITDEEASTWSPQVESIVEWFGQLREVDLGDIPPALRADVESEGWLRPDEPVEFPDRGKMLDQSPEMDGPFIKTPRSLVENGKDQDAA